MSDITTIQVEKKIVKEMKKAKKYPRQTYSELIADLLKAKKSSKNQSEEYVQSAKQEKMPMRWGNKEDAIWEKLAVESLKHAWEKEDEIWDKIAKEDLK